MIAVAATVSEIGATIALPMDWAKMYRPRTSGDRLHGAADPGHGPVAEGQEAQGRPADLEDGDARGVENHRDENGESGTAA